MSREIDPEAIANGTLTEAEESYLRDRGLLPEGYGNDQEEDSGEAEDYEEGWTNSSRRAELANRGLSVDGRKEELIDRLVRSDNDELTEEDQGETDEEDPEGNEE